MSSTPNPTDPKSSAEPSKSGESSRSGVQAQPTNTSQAESPLSATTLNFELTDSIERPSPTTEHLRRRRRDANMAELKQLFGMSPQTTHKELRDWLYENLSVIRHCITNTVPDPTAYIEHKGNYFELRINSPRARQITSRILTIVFVTDWQDDQEIKDAIEQIKDVEKHAANRKHISDSSYYHMWRQFATEEFRQAVKDYRKELAARREMRPQSLLRHMELAYPEPNQAANEEETSKAK